MIVYFTVSTTLIQFARLMYHILCMINLFGELSIPNCYIKDMRRIICRKIEKFTKLSLEVPNYIYKAKQKSMSSNMSNVELPMFNQINKGKGILNIIEYDEN